MTEDDGSGVAGMKIGNKVVHGSELLCGSGVTSLSVFVESPFITDANRMCVVILDMCSFL